MKMIIIIAYPSGTRQMFFINAPRFLATSGLIAFVSIVSNVPRVLAQTHVPGHEHEHYMIGLDSAETLSFGDYAGLANPNQNRLTFLFPHLHGNITDNHFHGIGAYSYTGDVTSPTVIPTSTNNRIPEYWTGLPPISLLPGSGVFSDRLITSKSDREYTNFKIAPVRHLEPYLNQPAVDYLYNSSNGRWTSSLGEAEIALQLLSITPGLGIADAQGQDLLSGVGDTYTLGVGDDFSFTPIFYTSKSAPLTNYSATFKLVDLHTGEGYTPLLESGTFSFDFQAVPEPLTILGTGVAFGMGVGLKKRFRSKFSPNAKSRA
jgi:hypothetical protein